jgi:hypothetical protein
MTKTEACRRVALAALLAGSMAAALEASAKIDLNIEAGALAGVFEIVLRG